MVGWGGYGARPSCNKLPDDRVESAEKGLAAALATHSQLTTHIVPEVVGVGRQ